MPDTPRRDHRDGTDGPTTFWDDWFRRQQDLHAASAAQWQALGDGWRSAMDAWWRQSGGQSPPAGRRVLRQAVDQGRAFFELADGVAGGAAGGGHDILWQLPLRIWEQAADETLARGKGAATALPALTDYHRALSDYGVMLQRVGAETLERVAATWDAGRPDAGLRELFDRCVDIGEQRYHDLVSSEAFARVGGQLVNSLVALAGAGGDPADAGDGDESGDPGEASPAGAPAELIARLGIAPERTLEELRDFARKLDVALATLKGIGAIDVGACARDVVLRDGKLTLYRYRPTTGATNPVPVLIVYALANRPYMMDLEPERSMIRGLLDAGLEVYLVDWGYPDDGDRDLDLADYVQRRLGDCVQSVCDRHGRRSISLLGVCQGGTFSLCFSALNPDQIHNLVLMVTPVDFHTPDNLLTVWLRHVDVDAMVDTLGNIPGSLLNWAFVSLKPLRLTGQKYLEMLDSLDDGEKAKTFLRMEKWIHDSPDQAGECFRQFVKDLYQDNKLVKGTLRIGGREVDLRRITMPVLNVYAAQDHIVPPAASVALERYIESDDYTTLEFDGGHIGIYVSNKAQRQIPRAIADWLNTRADSAAPASP